MNFTIKYLYVFVVFIICCIICYLVKDKKSSVVYTIVTGLIVTIIGAVLIPPNVSIYNLIEIIIKDPSIEGGKSGLKATETNAPPFQPDYAPGKENIDMDVIYKNNLGKFSKQDDMYYFATSLGLYKMKSNFKDCKLLIEDECISHLNVLGDWIYYSTKNGIFKIKTDGSEKTLVVELDGCPLDMGIYYNDLLYIKKSDDKLYSNCINGGNEKCILNKTIYAFSCVNSFYIYFIECKVDRTEDECSYRMVSLSEMHDNNIKILFKDKYNKNKETLNDTPTDFCEYNNEYIAFCNHFGFWIMDKTSGETEKINDIGGYNLCILGDYAYYSGQFPGKADKLIKVSLKSHKTESKIKVFDDDNANNFFVYPVEDKIILTLDFTTWYYLDKDDVLHRIDFDTQ